jgi:hypothetical protein
VIAGKHNRIDAHIRLGYLPNQQEGEPDMSNEPILGGPSKIAEVEAAGQRLVQHFGVDPATLTGLLRVAASILAALPEDLFEDGVHQATGDLEDMANEIRRAAQAN